MLGDKKGAEADRFLAALIETSPAAITVYDFEGNFLYVNQRALELHGYSREEFLKLKLKDLDAPESAALIRSRQEELKRRGEASFEVEHFRKDGTKLPLHIYVKMWKWDGLDVVLSIGTDITQQKQAEHEKYVRLVEETAERERTKDALRTSEEKYHAIIENIPDVVWTSDEYGNTPFISDSVTKTFGFTPEEIAADSNLWFGRIHKDDLARVKNAYEEMIKNGILFDLVYRLQRKDGAWIWVHDRAAKTYTKGGIRYADGIFRDITERKRVEEELRRYRDHLEDLIRERTYEIEVKNTVLTEEITERKRIEQSLRESEEMFRTLAESSPNLIFIYQEGKIIYVNRRFVEVLGYTIEDFSDPKFNIMTLLAPAFREAAAKMYLRHSAGTNIPQMEVTVISKDGRQIEAMYGSELINYRGKPAILGTSTNITARKRIEEDLRKSEARLKDAQALGRIGNWEFDIGTQKITWSDQTYRLYDRDPALGTPTPEEEANYYSADQVVKIRENARLAIEEGRTIKYDLEAHLPSGKSAIFFVTMQPIKDAQGRVVKLFGTVQDITESRRAEERLRQTNQFLDLIIDNIPLIITVKDARTLTYQRVNRTFAQESRMDPAEIMGMTADALFSPAEAKGITINDRKVIESKIISVFEGRETRTGRIYRTKKIPILNSAGEVEYLLSIADDVTEQIKIERELQALLEKALQISDFKSNLLSQAAHELKTPLTVILGWGNLLYTAKKEGKSLDTTFDLEDLETIVRNAERLDSLINDFLDVGRIESGKFEIVRKQVDFGEVLENATRAVDYLAKQKDINIISEKRPSASLSLDRRRMEQVFINILSNAIKYSPEHTRVTLKSEPVEINGSKMFRVQVIDEGFGFTPEELVEATTPFGRTSTQQEQKKGIQGTGLGLFISRRIVEQHGGTLVIHSEGANRGTNVEVLLPMNQ